MNRLRLCFVIVYDTDWCRWERWTSGQNYPMREKEWWKVTNHRSQTGILALAYFLMLVGIIVTMAHDNNNVSKLAATSRAIVGPHRVITLIFHVIVDFINSFILWSGEVYVHVHILYFNKQTDASTTPPTFYALAGGEGRVVVVTRPKQVMTLMLMMVVLHFRPRSHCRHHTS